MNLNPNNFEKPKDHLFFNFFAMYAKKSAEPQMQNENGIQIPQLDGLVLVGNNKDEN